MEDFSVQKEGKTKERADLFRQGHLTLGDKRGLSGGFSH